MKRIIAAVCLALLSACATYTTPAAGVSLAAIAEKDSDIADAFSREPAMPFPARLAIARLAPSGHAPRTHVGSGSSGFSVLAVRDIETDSAIERIANLPEIAGVATLSRLLLPTILQSIRGLRQSAAQLKADALLVYSIDTGVRRESDQ